MKITKLRIYIAKNFLVKFLQISIGFSLLIFFINLIDTFDKAREGGIAITIASLMAILQIPDFLNDIIPSLVLISAIITFFLLSSRSEITIMRSSGLSLWQILFPIAFLALLIGILWVIIFSSTAMKMSDEYNKLEAKYIQNEARRSNTGISQNGLWLKQVNIGNPSEELVIQAKKFYKENFELGDTTIWFLNEEGQFYQKIDSQSMILDKDKWILKKVVVNDGNGKINKHFEQLTIPTNLSHDFIMKIIVNNCQNVKLFSIFEIPQLIRDLKSAGFSPIKFQVYFQSLFAKPLLLLSMTLIACYFGLNHVRNNNSILMIFLGIVAGLVFYITSSIITELGSASLISVFASTWVMTIICLAIGILLIYKKENL